MIDITGKLEKCYKIKRQRRHGDGNDVIKKSCKMIKSERNKRRIKPLKRYVFEITGYNHLLADYMKQSNISTRIQLCYLFQFLVSYLPILSLK